MLAESSYCRINLPNTLHPQINPLFFLGVAGRRKSRSFVSTGIAGSYCPLPQFLDGPCHAISIFFVRTTPLR